MALFPTSGTSPGAFPGGTGSGGASGMRAGVAGTGGLAGRAAGGQPFSPLAGAAQRPLLSGGSTATSPGGKLQISNDEFLQLRDFIYAQSGIFIAEARKYLVENRLNNRIKALNLKSFGEYYYYLRFDPNRREELTKLFEVITTNETSFWRNPPQLQIFQDKVLTGELDKLRRSGQKKLRIWSAGCSTGEEPYTLAIILHEVLKSEISTWDIKITANDLSEAVLAAARKGVYSTYALRTTPRDIVARYFIAEGSDFRVDPRMKRLISFGPVNLSDKMMLKRVERSHIIFCRNVIIYFDEEMKRQVIESFYDNLLPGGCMLIGHSESLHNISRAFKPEYHAGTIVYRKEG
ncbi:MAG: protein-glutamate O-methyltransferase CheR [Desulfovibrio sp.]|jgi:chemotaxis protein methyltransferase CheR|nr:protein-glutamate O-methyltransferase CheR [Desulfovibrio sp.]